MTYKYVKIHVFLIERALLTVGAGSMLRGGWCGWCACCGRRDQEQLVWVVERSS